MLSSLKLFFVSCIVLAFLLTSSFSATSCPSYKFYSTTSSSCNNCSYSCLNCSSATDCTLCDSVTDRRVLTNLKACICTTGYFDDKVSTVCKACSTVITNCTDCFYNSTYVASDASKGALQYGCFSCVTGYLLVGNTCQLMAICPAGKGPNYKTNVCQNCPIGCLNCSTSNKCVLCNETSNYFLNVADSSCVSCNLNGCLNCKNLTWCQSCTAGLINKNGACYCSDGKYLDSSSNTCRICSPYCLTCTGPSSYECSSCNLTQHRLLIGSQCQCDSFNYQQSPNGTDCIKINSNLCERGYIYLSTTNQCVQICGDGWRIQYECDDGNVINTDGCSDKCKKQQYFVCNNQGNNPSNCKLKTQIAFSSIQIKKNETSNELIFKIDIKPDSVVYQRYNLNQIVHFRGGYLTTKQAYYDNGFLHITANYSKVLQGREVQLQIRQDYYFDENYPENFETVFNTTKTTFSFSSEKIFLTTSNNLKPNPYTQQQYAQAEKTKLACTIVMIIALVACGGALIIKNSLSIIVNINALQISYISLVTIQGMHPVTATLLQARLSLGYNNLQLFDLYGAETSIRVASIGFVEDFANNFNVMFFIQISFLVASALMGLASHKKPMIKLISSFLLREALLVIFFNLPTVFFTLTLMIKPAAINISFAIAASIVVIGQLGYLLHSGKNYYGFTEVFDFSDKGHFKKFIGMYFFCRLGTCLSFSFISVEPLKSLVAGAAFQAVFIIFISFVRPFYHNLNNIFMILAQILSISFFGNVYASQAVNSMGYDSREQSVDVMIYLIGAISLVIVANLIYSIVIQIKQGGKKLKAFNELMEAKKNRDQMEQAKKV